MQNRRNQRPTSADERPVGQAPGLRRPLRPPVRAGQRGLTLCILAAFVSAAPQDSVDRERYAQEYVQFLALQLDEWTKGFPHGYNLALVRPQVDSAKLSEAAKAGANNLREVITKLHSIASAPNVAKSSEFRSHLEGALAVAKHVNETMGKQRFPAVLQSDWDQFRTNLNNLARIYRLDQLAILEAPTGGRGGRGAATAASTAPAVPGGLAGYLVDKQCAVRGKGMWVNTECIKRCLRDGDSVVLVTEEGKVFSIANPDKIDPDAYGQKVTLIGKTQGESITVESLK